MSKPQNRLKDARKLIKNKEIIKVFPRRRVEQSGLDHIWTMDIGGPHFTSNQAKSTTNKLNQEDTIADKILSILNIDTEQIGENYDEARRNIRAKLNVFFTETNDVQENLLNSFNDDPELRAVATGYFKLNQTKPQLLERLAQTSAKVIFPGQKTQKRQTTKSDLVKNGNFNYVLYVLDIFSRFLWTQPLKTTKPDEVKQAFIKILEKSSRRPRAYIWTDEGAEFDNILPLLPIEDEIKNRRVALSVINDDTADNFDTLPFQTKNTDGEPVVYEPFEGKNHLNKRPPFIDKVEQYHTHSKNKAVMAERVIKTIQDMMEVMPEILQPTRPKCFNIKLSLNGVSRENIKEYEQALIDEGTCPFFSDWSVIKDMTMLEYATHRYNNNFHRSLIIQREQQRPIKFTPTSASMPENESELLEHFYKTSFVPQGKKEFIIGDVVRVVLEDKIKNKGQLIWSPDKYKIAQIKPTHPITYKVRPENGGALLKRSFYTQEIWKVERLN